MDYDDYGMGSYDLYNGGMSAEEQAFDAALEKWQERQYENAIEAEALGNLQAQRPEARHDLVSFAELRVGDFMTAEPEVGARARWVQVTEVKALDDDVMRITFRTPQPIGVGQTETWIIERPTKGLATIDLTGEARQ